MMGSSGHAWRQMRRAATTLSVVALLLASTNAWAGKPIVAQGGRTHPCGTIKQCRSEAAHLRRAILWQKKARHHANAVRYGSDVRAAIELASRLSGVSFDRLWKISGCESTHDPTDVLGQYQGLFQLGRYHRSLPDIRGLDPFNPYVNAIHAALFIARHGESQWSCRSDGSVAY